MSEHTSVPAADERGTVESGMHADDVPATCTGFADDGCPTVGKSVQHSLYASMPESDVALHKLAVKLASAVRADVVGITSALDEEFETKRNALTIAGMPELIPALEVSMTARRGNAGNERLAAIQSLLADVLAPLSKPAPVVQRPISAKAAAQSPRDVVTTRDAVQLAVTRVGRDGLADAKQCAGSALSALTATASKISGLRMNMNKAVQSMSAADVAAHTDCCVIAANHREIALGGVTVTRFIA
jgi:hypothetical protein